MLVASAPSERCASLRIAAGRSRRCSALSCLIALADPPSASRGSRSGNAVEAGSAGVGATLRARALLGERGQRRGDRRGGQCVAIRCRGRTRERVAVHIRYVGEQTLERGKQLGVFRRTQIAARAELGVDLRQNAVVGEKAVERHVDLVDARRDVREHPLHQRPPHAAVGIDRARGDADRVEHVHGRERIVDVGVVALRHQRMEARVERGNLAPRVDVQLLRRRNECRLLGLIEVAEHLHADVRFGIRAAALAALAGHPALEVIVDRLFEPLQPFAAPRAKALDFGLGNVGVPFEQVARHVERRARDVDEPRLVEREALAEQDSRLGGAEAFGAGLRVRRSRLIEIVGHGRRQAPDHSSGFHAHKANVGRHPLTSHCRSRNTWRCGPQAPERSSTSSLERSTCRRRRQRATTCIPRYDCPRRWKSCGRGGFGAGLPASSHASETTAGGTG